MIKNPQYNSPVEQVHQVILNILVTKDLDNKVFNYTGPWGETLSSIALSISASYHCNNQSTSGQSIFGRYMIFNLTSVVECRVITAANQ